MVLLNKACYYLVDLSKHMTQKLFYECSGERKQRIRFDKDSAFNDKHIFKEQMLYGIPYVFCINGKDNLICEGQEIIVETKINKIYIVGFSYWGDKSDILKIVLKKRRIIEKEVLFKECSIDNDNNPWVPLYEKNLDIKYSCFNSKLIGVNEQNDLFFTICECSLGEEAFVEKIILPKNYFIHIYAITFEV